MIIKIDYSRRHSANIGKNRDNKKRKCRCNERTLHHFYCYRFKRWPIKYNNINDYISVLVIYFQTKLQQMGYITDTDYEWLAQVIKKMET